MNNLGEEIRKKRLEKGLTIDDLSKRTMLSPAVLKDIENGAFDRYEGDETYVKMYLKKISDALDMDREEVTKSYIALTEEIKQEELAEAAKEAEEEGEARAEKKSVKLEKPQFTKKASVYEDKSHIKIIRVVIALLIVALIAVLIFIAVVSTHKSIETKNYTKTSDNVTGDVKTKKDKEKEEAEKKKKASETTQETPKVAAVTFSKNANYNYNFALTDTSAETFTFKVEFVTRAWAQLQVNGKVDTDFEARVYQAGESATVTLKSADVTNMRFSNGASKGAKYYINDVQVPLTDEETNNANLTRVRFTKVASIDASQAVTNNQSQTTTQATNTSTKKSTTDNGNNN